MTELATLPRASESAAPAPELAQNSPAERKEALARVVSAQVAYGARVESQSDYEVVLVRGHSTLHQFLTVVKVGTWIFAWILLWLIGDRETRSVASVDKWGKSTIGGR